MKILVTILLAIAAVSLLLWSKPESKAELQPIPLARVISVEVKTADMAPSVTLTGKLQPARLAKLRFELSGRVNSRRVEPGQVVETGNVLLTIDDGDFIDRLSEAASMLEQEEKAIARDRNLLSLLVQEREIQQRELKRLERLGQESLSSKSKYDSAMRALLALKAQESNLRNSVNTAVSRLNTRQAKLNLAERDVSRTQLTSPFNATVNAVHYELGDYAAAGQIAVELVQLEQMDLYLEVSGKVMSTLSMGQAITVRTSHDEKQGSIIAMEPDPKTDTLTHAIRIRVDGVDLYAGQLAEATLPAPALNDVAVVPVSSVLHEDGQAYVFEIMEGRLKRRQVDLLARQNDMQSIKGLEAGVRIVSQDVAALADGQEVSSE